MATAPIPFVNQQQSGWEGLAGASAEAINVGIDGRGALRRRPAIVAYADGPSSSIDSDGIIGLHTTNGGKVYAVGGGDTARSVYRIAGGEATELHGGVGYKLTGSARPVFAETDAMVVIAGGGKLQKVLIEDDSSARLGGDPPNATHVVANQLRLVANDAAVDRTKLRYSDIAIGSDISGHETWSFAGIGLSGFVTAEARPDPVLAVGETSDEVFAFGTTNVQVFGKDGQTVYAPVVTREYGISAPYSVIKMDEVFCWLDHRRRFVQSDGRARNDITAGIAPVLDAMTTVSDCFGFRVDVSPMDCLVWVFPSEGVTFSYQQGSGWSQWQGYDAGGNWKPWPVTSLAKSHVSAESLVGLSDGRVAMLQMGGSSDLGEPIVASVTTGSLDRGTGMKKHCIAVHLTMRRPTEEGKVLGWLSWADEPGRWSSPRAVVSGVAPVISLRSLGVYRTRAWRFVFSDDSDFALAAAEEEFELLDQ